MMMMTMVSLSDRRFRWGSGWSNYWTTFVVVTAVITNSILLPNTFRNHDRSSMSSSAAWLPRSKHIPYVSAWTVVPAHISSLHYSYLSQRYSSPLFYMSSSSGGGEGEETTNNEDIELKKQLNDSKQYPIRERLAISGVSVSPKGFHAILKGSSRGGSTSTSKINTDNEKNNDDRTANPEQEQQVERFLALKVTNDPMDHRAATSAESLTICQLLSGVDMAGAILPPELLSRMVVYYIEQKWQDLQDETNDETDDDGNGNDITDEMTTSTTNMASSDQTFLTPQELKVLHFVKEALPEGQESYKDAPEWFQSRTRLPQVTLDQLTLSYDSSDLPTQLSPWKCKLECNLPEMDNLRLVIDDLDPDTVAPLVFNYDPETSLLFTCLALSLRYKAPIVLERLGKQQQDEESTNSNDSIWSTSDQLNLDFPQRTTVHKLQQQSTRVIENVERGFAIHQLTGALRIAMKMGDTKAAEKIRAKLDEYDSFQDLPTTVTKQQTNDDPSSTRTNDDDDDRNNEGSLDDLENNLFQ